MSEEIVIPKGITWLDPRFRELMVALAEKEELFLPVAEDVKEDEGKGLVRLDKASRDWLKVKIGDYVEIVGPYPQVGTVAKTLKEDEGKKVVRISRDLRRRVPVSIGIEADIRKAKPWALERFKKGLLKGFTGPYCKGFR